MSHRRGFRGVAQPAPGKAVGLPIDAKLHAHHIVKTLSELFKCMCLRSPHAKQDCKHGVGEVLFATQQRSRPRPSTTCVSTRAQAVCAGPWEASLHDGWLCCSGLQLCWRVSHSCSKFGVSHARASPNAGWAGGGLINQAL